VETPFTDVLVPLDGSQAAERALVPALELIPSVGLCWSSGPTSPRTPRSPAGWPPGKIGRVGLAGKAARMGLVGGLARRSGRRGDGRRHRPHSTARHVVL
jgi:hypothetical protein